MKLLNDSDGVPQTRKVVNLEPHHPVKCDVWRIRLPWISYYSVCLNRLKHRQLHSPVQRLAVSWDMTNFSTKSLFSLALCIYVFACFLQQTVKTRRMIFLMNTHCVLCEVRAEILHTKQTTVSSQTVNMNTILVNFF
jgi:hypothetical protein